MESPPLRIHIKSTKRTNLQVAYDSGIRSSFQYQINKKKQPPGCILIWDLCNQFQCQIILKKQTSACIYYLMLLCWMKERYDRMQ